MHSSVVTVMSNAYPIQVSDNKRYASAVQIRRQAYWALLWGGCGQFIGNFPIEEMNLGWQSALHSRGALNLT